MSDARLEAAKDFGAEVIVNNSREDPLRVIRDLAGRLGADVSIEAVGLPATFELAVKLVRPGGRIANIGVHGGAVTLHLDEQWTRDITITTGLKGTSSTPTLMRLVTSGQIDAKRFITHHFGLDEMEARTTSSPEPRTPARSRSSSAAETGQKTGVRTMNTPVKDVMTIRVVSVKRDTSFKEMATALRENWISPFPVLDDDGEVLGLVSEAELLTKQALEGGYDGMPGMITGLLRRKEQMKARDNRRRPDDRPSGHRRP